MGEANADLDDFFASRGVENAHSPKSRTPARRVTRGREPAPLPPGGSRFEASPLIQPFAEKFFAWLRGERKSEPDNS